MEIDRIRKVKVVTYLKTPTKEYHKGAEYEVPNIPKELIAEVLAKRDTVEVVEVKEDDLQPAPVGGGDVEDQTSDVPEESTTSADSSSDGDDEDYVPTEDEFLGGGVSQSIKSDGAAEENEQTGINENKEKDEISKTSSEGKEEDEKPNSRQKALSFATNKSRRRRNK